MTEFYYPYFAKALFDTQLSEKTIVFATKEDLAKVEGKLLSAINEAKVDIIKWMVATAIAIVGLTIALMKLV